MAETEDNKEQAPYPGEEDLMRQQLLRRIGVAGVMIMLLVGGLALFDAFNTPQPQEPAKVAAAPAAAAEVPIAPKEPESQTATGVIEEEKTADKGEGDKAEDKVVSEPERTESVGAPPLRSAERPLTKPATARPASMRPTPAQAAPEPAREAERSQTAAAASKHAPASRPLSQAVADPNRRYVLQMGVFNNVSNAEDLRAKIAAAGIPSQIEARVQVGPFNSRAEAEAAQKKLVALGLDSGMLVSSKK